MSIGISSMIDHSYKTKSHHTPGACASEQDIILLLCMNIIIMLINVSVDVL